MLKKTKKLIRYLIPWSLACLMEIWLWFDQFCLEINVALKFIHTCTSITHICPNKTICTWCNTKMTPCGTLLKHIILVMVLLVQAIWQPKTDVIKRSVDKLGKNWLFQKYEQIRHKFIHHLYHYYICHLTHVDNLSLIVVYFII